MRHLSQWTALLLSVTLLSSCNFFKKGEGVSDFETYESPMGFQIKYPKGWEVREVKGVDTSLGGANFFPAGSIQSSAKSIWNKDVTQQLITVGGGTNLETYENAKKLLTETEAQKLVLHDVKGSATQTSRMTIDGEEAIVVSYVDSVNDLKGKAAVLLSKPVKQPDESLAIFLVVDYKAKEALYSEETAMTVIGSFKERVLKMMEEGEKAQEQKQAEATDQAINTVGDISPSYLPTSAQSSITILSPNGGEVWSEGSTQTIRWASHGSDALQPVEIDLERKSPTDTQFWNIGTIATDQPGLGSYVWKVSALDTTGRTIDGSQYKILVGRNLDKGTGPVDESDAPFTIAPRTSPFEGYDSSKQTLNERNAERQKYVSVIANGLYQYTLDHHGPLPIHITTEPIEICRGHVKDCGNMVNFQGLGDVVFFPMDPQAPVDGKGTWFTVQMEGNKLTIAAPHAEGGKISASRDLGVGQSTTDDHATQGSKVHIRGNPDAPISITEFCTRECYPSADRNTVLDRHGNTINWIRRNFTISFMHKDEELIGEAKECAADIGDNEVFWQYDDRSDIPGYEVATNEKLINIAEEVGIDAASFKECLVSKKYESSMLDDTKYAKEHGVDGEPSFIIENNITGQSEKVGGGMLFKKNIDSIITRLSE